MANKKKDEKFDDEIEEEEETLADEVEEEEDDADSEEELPSEEPKKKVKGTDATVIFVNNEKLARAKGILDLVSGKRAARDANEAERTEHFRAQMNHAGKKPTDKDAVRFIYELLGGLVRTPEEQREADKKAAALKAKYKKRKVESDADARSSDE